MAALPSIYPEGTKMYFIQSLSNKMPQIAIDFRTGDYVFQTPVMIKARNSVLESLKIPVIAGGAIGFVVGGALGAKYGMEIGILYTAKKTAQGAGIGALLGIGAGVAVGGTYALIRGGVTVYRRTPKVVNKANEILKELFSSSANLEEGAAQFSCPISNDLLLFPVSTGCNARRDGTGKVMRGPKGKIIRTGPMHIFEYNSLLISLQESKKCPFPGCQEDIHETEFSFEIDLRERIHKIVSDSLVRLASFQPKFVDYIEKEKDFLENAEEICGRIGSDNLQGDDISFLSYLVRKTVKTYSEMVDNVARNLTKNLLEASEKNPEIEFQERNLEAAKIMALYKIKLPKQLVEESDEKEQGEP